MIGETVGSYRVVSQLGEGGMGVVYLAEHTLLGKRAAVKVLRPELSGNPKVLDRFFNEARAATVIAHPGIIEIFDFGHHASGAAYIIMEFLDGESLSGRLRRMGTLPHEMTAEIARQSASILGAAHEQSIVHRDIKPDNIFLLPSRELPSGIRVKILDFGIAKLSGDLAVGPSTRTGSLLGTPNYMSPEQCRGAKDLDGATDIYALGCVMFEMVAGRPPFNGEGLGEVMVGHLREVPPPLGSFNATVPPGMVALVEKCLAKEVADRPRSMAEVEDAIRSLGLPTVFDPAFIKGPGGPGQSVRPTPSARTPSPSNPPQLQAAQRSPSSGAREPAAAPVVTTLSAAAGQVQGGPSPSGKSSSSFIAIGVALLLAGGGGAAWILTRKPAAPPAPATVPVAAPDPVVKADPTPPPAPPPSPTVKLTIKSTPPGAEIHDGKSDAIVGRTPTTLTVDRAAGESAYRLHLEGYEDAPLSLETSVDGTGTVTLRPVAVAPVVAPAPAKSRSHSSSSKGGSRKGKPGGGDIGLFD